MTGQEEMTRGSCGRRGLDCISGNISSPEGLSRSGTGFPGKCLSHHPCRFLRCEPLETFIGGLCSVRLQVFSSLNDYMIPWKTGVLICFYWMFSYVKDQCKKVIVHAKDNANKLLWQRLANYFLLL